MIQDLGNDLIPVMAIGCTFLFFVIWVVLATINSLFKTACNTKLKDKLVERGVSARDIDLILKAGTADEEMYAETRPTPPVKVAHR